MLSKWIGTNPDMSPSNQTIDVLGFHTTTLSRTEILDLVRQWIVRHEVSHHLMALNPIKVCRARKEHELALHIHEADLVYPDAYGIAWAMSRFSRKKYKPIPGCDLMLDLVKLAAENKFKIYLVGAAQNIVEKTRDLFLKDYPNLIICGIRNGYFADQTSEIEVAKEIVKAQPDIVLVAMGAKIQEDLIKLIQSEAVALGSNIPLLMGVGGSFDAVTNNVPRPPRWMLNMHLEWLFRLLQQPFRAPRMIALPKFALLTIAKKYFRLNVDNKTQYNFSKKLILE
ncbi:WecB/TagA/CpsF family glycosyltransferase [bacterium]|nr:WecB/TagA/CpsF family glycosyltransferase [bacterium]